MSTTAAGKNKTAIWFDDLISTLRLHEVQLETGTADPKLAKLYEILQSDNIDEMFKVHKAASQEYFVKKIIVEYLRILDEKLPLRLAFDFNDSEVLVWAEIENNSEEQESLLTRAEAKINALYHPYGFDMESMIVEKGDNIPIPNHYKIYK